MFGLITSLMVNMFLGIGSIKYGHKPILKELSTNLCDNNSTSFSTTAASIFNNSTILRQNSGFSSVYDISYYWFSLIAITIVFTLGITISLITNKFTIQKPLEDNLLFFKSRRVSLIYMPSIKIAQQLNNN